MLGDALGGSWGWCHLLAAPVATAGARAFPSQVPYVPSEKKGKVEDEEHLEAAASSLTVGSRCEVEGGRRGVVQFVGKCEGLPLGYWAGVQYDEPVGKNDGSVKGKRYFECPPGYGAFVRPNLVKCGDFPAFDEDFNFSDDDEI